MLEIVKQATMSVIALLEALEKGKLGKVTMDLGNLELVMETKAKETTEEK